MIIAQQILKIVHFQGQRSLSAASAQGLPFETILN
jgi:hypothetical protein